MKSTVKYSFMVEDPIGVETPQIYDPIGVETPQIYDPMPSDLWPTVRLCVKCWKVRVQDKQVCSECEAEGLSPDGKAVDVSYSNINHVSCSVKLTQE